MSTILVKILFTGLMAFVPNENGSQVTVLLLNSGHYHTSDGAGMQAHKPLIVARAGNCTGDCTDNDPEIAEFLYADQTSTAALTSLANAVDNGSAWIIDGSDIAIEKESSNAANLPAFSMRAGRGTTNYPATSTERGDASWIASLSQICGSGCTLDPDVFDNVPPPIVAARFTLNTGELYTHSIARLGANVTPVNFKRLDGTGSPSAYVQAVSAWVGADIEVNGTGIKFVETKHDASPGRSMTLTADNSGVIEVAVLNLPPFIPPASSSNEAPQVGKHYEVYYDLLQSPPSRASRLVPFVGSASSTTWSSVHPSGDIYSELLSRLRMDVDRTLYDRAICAPTTWP